MANYKKTIEGSIDITGVLKVLGKIDSPTISSIKSAVKAVSSQSTTVQGALGTLVDQAADDNYLTTTEKKNLLTKWEEVKTEYPIIRQGALDDGISEENILIVNLDAAYTALRTYCFVEPGVLSDSTTGEEINGVAFIAVWEAYYTYRSQLMSERVTLKANSSDVPSGASYLGMFAAAPTADYVGDWYTNSTTGLLYVWTGTEWSTSGITSTMRMWAMEDLLAIASTAAQTFASLLVAYEGFFETLVASEGFIGALSASEAFIESLVASEAFIAEFSSLKIYSSADEEYNYWDLSTGEFRIGNATDYLFFDVTNNKLTICLSSGTLVVGGTDPQGYTFRVAGTMLVTESAVIGTSSGLNLDEVLFVGGSIQSDGNISLYGGIRIEDATNYLAGSITENTLFGKLFEYIPYNSSAPYMMLVCGAICTPLGTFPDTYTVTYIISRAIRTSENVITFHGLTTAGVASLITVTNGSSNYLVVSLAY